MTSTTGSVGPPVPSRAPSREDCPARPAAPTRGRRGIGSAIPLITLLALGTSAAHAVGVTVAFVGDQGHRENAEHLMELVRERGVDLLILGGDLGYGEDAEPWIEMMERALGEGFPVISAVGNHENYNWPQYRSWLAERIERVPELSCEGDIGVKAHCRFRGLSIVQTASGVHEVPGVVEHDGYAEYIEREFADDPSPWRICSWHKNQSAMQIGNKSDSTGWDVYEACREAGALVATAHEHSYSRTYLMSDFNALEVAHRDDHLVLERGRSLAFVSGLGGRTPREQTRDGHWWASTYAAGDGASAGALFCTFGDHSAECRFEDINGAVPDRFTLGSDVGLDSATPDGGERDGDTGSGNEAPTEHEAPTATPAVPASDETSTSEPIGSATAPPEEGQGVSADEPSTAEPAPATASASPAGGATAVTAPAEPDPEAAAEETPTPVSTDPPVPQATSLPEEETAVAMTDDSSDPVTGGGGAVAATTLAVLLSFGGRRRRQRAAQGTRRRARSGRA